MGIKDAAHTEDLKFVLPETDERFLPTSGGEIALEHWHRYLVARDFVKGQKVLDLACGEGYGSFFLADHARSVLGVDISTSAVAHAKNSYKKPNLEYSVGRCEKVPAEDASFDVVVSFETIEHHEHHEQMLKEIKRVLRPGGLLIISSPDKYYYSDLRNFKNPYHVKELYLSEFKNWLGSGFANVKLWGQRVVLGSGFYLEEKSAGYTHFQLNTDGRISTSVSGMPNPYYWVAIASDSQLPPVQNSVLEQVDFMNQVLALQERIVDVGRQLTDISVQYHEVLSSWSWRVTSPCRYVSSLLKKLLG